MTDVQEVEEVEDVQDVIRHRTRAELDAGVELVRASPVDGGTLEMIVARPALGEREVLDVGRLDLTVGLEGDTWIERGSRRTDDGSSHPDMQLNVMNVRAARLLAGSDDRVPLAGDQLYVDLSLAEDDLPPGTQLAVGAAVIEITDQPHTGCAKFRQRFGADALRWISSSVGSALKLRGVNAKVVEPGEIRAGDSIERR